MPAAGWERPISETLTGLFNDIVEDVRGGANVLNRALVKNTPVDTGRLRGGWQGDLTGGAPFGRPPDDKIGEITIALMDAIVAKMLPGDTYTVDNYTFYGPYVNDGTRLIEPRRFVERSIDEVDAYFR